MPHYNLHVKNVEVGDSGDYPVTVTLQRMEPDRQGQEETVRARYVVGCDGARSSVRQSIGRSLVGDVANQAWGVMDVLAVTDFPDIRLKSVIHSANEGNVLIIPREGGYLVRFYIELDKLNPDQHLTTKDITTDQLIAAATGSFIRTLWTSKTSPGGPSTRSANASATSSTTCRRRR